MKQFRVCFLILGLFLWGQAHALPTEHPANPDVVVPAFQPADHFAGQAGSVSVAAADHQHDAAPAAQESGSKMQEGSDGKGCMRSDEMGCCCKCCCKDSGDGAMMCKKKSGDAGKMGSDMKGCDMMKKGMQQEGGAATEAADPAETEKEHESHH